MRGDATSVPLRCKLRHRPYSPCYNKSACRFRPLPSRLGAPQLIAIVLLLVFAGQCVWFMAHQPLSAMEGVYVEAGLLQLEGLASANSPQHTALVPLMAGIAARVSGAEKHVDEFNNYRMIMRLPFLIAGVLLGASLWYVARRLYGNIGGYVALVLYCFSPVDHRLGQRDRSRRRRRMGRLRPDLHQHCRRPHALCAARGGAVELAPHSAAGTFDRHLRRRAVFLLGAAAAGAAVHALGGTCAAGRGAGDLRCRLPWSLRSCLWAFYGFRPVAFAHALRSANWLEIASREFLAPGMSWLLHSFFLDNGLGLLILVAVSLVTFIVWKRARFFGTAAPLLVTLLLFSFAVRMQFSRNLLSVSRIALPDAVHCRSFRGFAGKPLCAWSSMPSSSARSSPMP